MATPNGRGGWDLTDEDVDEIVAVSFGPDEVELDKKKIDYRIEHKARVLKFAWRSKEFVKDVDGHWYWVPDRPRGLFSAAHLRVLSDLLVEANRKFDREVEAFFKNEKAGATKPKHLDCNCRGGPHGGYTDPKCR